MLLLSFLGGCASQPQLPVAYSDQSFNPSSKIGLAVSEIPMPALSYPGAGCLLCLAAASAANGNLSKHVKTLSPKDLERIASMVQKRMSELGYDIIIIDSPLYVKNLQKFSSKEPNTAKKDFSYFKETYDIDYLIGIELDVVGLQRFYAGYAPTTPPQVIASGRQYAVRISDNTYTWFKPLNILRNAEGEWKESPNYPGLTNAYYQVIEMVLDEVANINVEPVPKLDVSET